MRSRLLLTFLVFLMSTGSVVPEANAQADASTTDAVEEQQANDAENTSQDNQQQESQLSGDDEEESPDRVTSTEQISQDLGVSFPVDI